MARASDITGREFGRLTAVEAVGKQKREMLWRCVCTCGKECVVRLSNLTSGNTISCGCWQKEARYRK